ncbi:CAF1 family ribonuclease-domain-containing protein [Syncephalastrum racemosum]|uniref:CAF1 family ribonuclease-domain-containing protein n=1 Tax=Syncephalastrum racemosum TaxID=13706 RepID=A0A1X2HEL4_SYNRA|nr:CAF1 family ribonuclease-domain-containing protein [Syncephalastrum racemosum]
MEIPRQEFQQMLPTIKKAIDECDFIAIDTELSGLHRPGNSKRMDTLENRYAEFREATQRFIIIQFGMCTFTWDEKAGRYIARAFNFYVFPTAMTGKIQPNRVFMTQAQAFDFLSKQAFDFNKWVYQGIPYLTKEEEEAYISQATQRMTDDLPDIPVDDKEKAFMEKAKQKIDIWVKDPKKTEDPEGVNINTRNAYQRRLIYQEVRKSYSELTAEGRSGFIRVMRLTQKQLDKRAKEKLARIKKDCEEAVGFRTVIDWISASRKYIVGHNMLLDVCHMIGQFVQPLPEKLSDFKKLAHDLFPYMADTKYICSTAAILQSEIGSATSLENLRFETNCDKFKNPRIDMHMEFPRYINEKAHEAGYDAYITGSVFLKLHSYLEFQLHPEKVPQEKEEEPEAESEKEEEEEEEEEKEERHRGTEGGWDVSDQEEEEDRAWLDSDEEKQEQVDEEEKEEEVYNYGSVRFPLINDDGKVPEALSEYVNKVTIVRTGFAYFDFVNPEAIQETAGTFYISSGTELPRALVYDAFGAFGKHIVDMTDANSGFVVYEYLKQDPDHVKAAVAQQLHDAGVEGLTIMTVSEYYAEQKERGE